MKVEVLAKLAPDAPDRAARDRAGVTGAGSCDDCHRGARLSVAPGGEGKELRLCPRCARYLARTLLARIEEHGL